VNQAYRGLLVPLGQQARLALLGQLAMMGPRDHRETPVQQASRARLELLAQLVPKAQPEPMVQLGRKGRKATLGT
jgi:hypothetical protein